MAIWPYWPVWPFLMALGVLVMARNPAVGAAVVAQVALVQVVKWWGPAYAQYLYFAIYSTGALICALFFDRAGGFIFATIAVLYAAFLVGLIGHYPKVVFAEIAMVAGVAIAGINGPDRGLLDRLRAVPSDRSGDPALHGPLHVARDAQGRAAAAEGHQVT